MASSSLAQMSPNDTEAEQSPGGAGHKLMEAVQSVGQLSSQWSSQRNWPITG